MQIDTLVMVIADQNGGKSNQMRTIFEEHELFAIYNGYPTQNNIARRYLVAPDIELLIRLSSYLFCPRQCALIHLEGLWNEDGATAEGRLLHERVDAGGLESRGAVRVARALQLRSIRLGVAGKSDVVEFRGRPPIPYPVEYKRGWPKSHRADEVQLCAQALCLEEMFECVISEGALFYGQQHRRTVVTFDEQLRDLTLRTATEARAMIADRRTPRPVFKPACRRCSLEDACQPKRMQAAPDVAQWLTMQQSGDDCPEALPT